MLGDLSRVRINTRILTQLFTAVLSLLINSHAFAETESVHVAVASNFAWTMRDIISRYENSTGGSVTISLGSSGKLYAQIRHGAPYDAFLSADQTKPQQLERDDLAVEESRFTYAEGKLLLWSRTSEFFSQGTQRFSDLDFNRLALANPRLAPYGVAAMEVLQHLGLTDRVKPRLVYGENIAQAFQFVMSGNADAGFIAVAQYRQQDSLKGDFWVVPDSMYSPIKQDAVILKRTDKLERTQDFMDFLRTAKIQQLIQDHGYSLPDDSTDDSHKQASY